MNRFSFLKRIAFCLLCALALVASDAAQKKEPAKEQESEKKLARKEVPAAVLAAFERAYPKAKILGYTEGAPRRALLARRHAHRH
jgi:hypothetical protein